ncbi:hypothetical protein VTK73DRAFT_3124 [Phialemonium thermophilum]|uniref:EamA domain-containing protein n=1 Tax=Phialemonium thermophilum TaxID=223376 RepID=A0ABR3VKM6_9PEZI
MVPCSCFAAPAPMLRQSRVASFVERWRPSLYVFGSQVAAATLNSTAKFVETRHGAVHPFMILHVRMLLTGLGCASILWHVGSPRKADVLLGGYEVRRLVFLRALSGVCSAAGFFFSMVYLSLSQATALSFLGPLGSLIVARWMAFAAVPWTDILGAVGALLGVVLVSHPERVFDVTGGGDGVSRNAHLKGLAFGVTGVAGYVVALTSMRRIGTRAHALTSVHVFAWSMVFVSGLALVLIPDIAWPTDPFVWACLCYVGVSGLAMEYLLTLGLSKDPSSAATLMIYSQIVWALVLDSILFRITAGALEVMGAGIIIGSLCVVTLCQERQGSSESPSERERPMGPNDLSRRMNLGAFHCE